MWNKRDCKLKNRNKLYCYNNLILIKLLWTGDSIFNEYYNVFINYIYLVIIQLKVWKIMYCWK